MNLTSITSSYCDILFQQFHVFKVQCEHITQVNQISWQNEIGNFTNNIILLVHKLSQSLVIVTES